MSATTHIHDDVTQRILMYIFPISMLSTVLAALFFSLPHRCLLANDALLIPQLFNPFLARCTIYNDL